MSKTLFFSHLHNGCWHFEVGAIHPWGVSSDHAFFVVWELWIYVLWLYIHTTVSTKYNNFLLKGHVCTCDIFSFAENTLVVLHFLLLKPKCLEFFFSKLTARPLYQIFPYNFIISTLTVGSLFPYRCKLCIVLCTTNTHTHTHTHRNCQSLYVVRGGFYFLQVCCMR